MLILYNCFQFSFYITSKLSRNKRSSQKGCDDTEYKLLVSKQI